ncbi:endogenous retrovirus group K member 5 Gag polyprotein-like [Molothrus aeneus]|uniref:endogenous retrovirus group K member 5 Gag polyprotein-like n=1 Tax=Molothrus aeneus TaxID=84833 RepID=UPI00345B120D
MGAKLSVSHKDVYYHFLNFLKSEKIRFSKSDVKQFVRWLFLHFPDVSTENISDLAFWDKIGNELLRAGKSGDTSPSKFVFLALQIRNVVKSNLKMQEQPTGNSFNTSASQKPDLPPSKLCSPSPNPLSSPPAPTQGILKKVTLPSFPQKLPVSNPDSSGQTPRDPTLFPASPSCETPSHNLSARLCTPDSLQVTSPDHDGGYHMAMPGSSLHNPLRSPNNPFWSENRAPETLPPGTLPPPPSAPSGLCPPAAASLRPSRSPPSSSQVTETGGAEFGSQKPETSLVLSAAPVSYISDLNGGIQPHYTPLSVDSVKELAKAQKDFGRSSEYFRGLLKATLSANTLTPADIKHLFTCLLSSSEYLLWDAAWKKGLREILPAVWADEATAHDVYGKLISLDHLCGQGEWEDGASQAEGIPRKVFKECARAAEKAFFGLRPGVPLENYLKITQSSSESFLSFVERLRKAVEFQVQNERARMEILTEIAKENANEKCKAAILSLPLDPAPTLQSMLEVCERKVTITLADQDERPKPQRKIAAVDAPDPPSTNQLQRVTMPQERTSNSNRPCHLCGKLGHWMPDCPLKKQFLDFKYNNLEDQNSPKDNLSKN